MHNDWSTDANENLSLPYGTDYYVPYFQNEHSGISNNFSVSYSSQYVMQEQLFVIPHPVYTVRAGFKLSFLHVPVVPGTVIGSIYVGNDFIETFLITSEGVLQTNETSPQSAIHRIGGVLTDDTLVLEFDHVLHEASLTVVVNYEYTPVFETFPSEQYYWWRPDKSSEWQIIKREGGFGRDFSGRVMSIDYGEWISVSPPVVMGVVDTESLEDRVSIL